MAHKVGDTVTVTRGPHKGDAHKVIHVHKDGRVNVKPHNKMPHQIKYRHGAATAKSHEVKKMKESTMKSFMEIARSMTPMRDKFGKSKAEKEAEKKKKYPDHLTVDKAKKAFAPTKGGADAKKDEGYVSHAQRKAVWANKADGGKGHPDNKKEGTIITPKDFKMKDDDKNKLKKIADLMKKAKATKNENQKAALMKKLAKSAQSSEKGKKAVTLAKAPFKIPSKNEGAMKRIATSQSSKADRMAPGKGLDTFKKKPPEKNEVLDKDKDHMSYRQKAKYSMDRARNSATAKIVRGKGDDIDKEKNTLRKRQRGMDMSDRKGVRQFRKFHGYDKKK